jgi:hypothetical protein
VLSFGFRVLGFGFWVSGFRFWDFCYGFWVSGFGFRVLGFGFRVCAINTAFEASSLQVMSRYSLSTVLRFGSWDEGFGFAQSTALFGRPCSYVEVQSAQSNRGEYLSQILGRSIYSNYLYQMLFYNDL